MTEQTYFDEGDGLRPLTPSPSFASADTTQGEVSPIGAAAARAARGQSTGRVTQLRAGKTVYTLADAKPVVPTEEQIAYLRFLGYDGEIPGFKVHATELIEALLWEVGK